MRQARARTVGVVVLAMVLFGASLALGWQVAIPGHVRITADAVRRLDPGLPLPVSVKAVPPGRLHVMGGWDGSSPATAWMPLTVEGVRPGRAELHLRLFGRIPLRPVTVDVVPRAQVVPSGHAVGITVRSQGVLVVDYAPVPLDGGGTAMPAREAGIQPGDLIVAIDGTPVTQDWQAVQLIDGAGRRGRPVEVEVRRHHQVFRRRIETVFNRDQQRFAIGVWIRDRMTGVGTLTFYDPQSRRYAALGHVVSDPETQVPLPIAGGEILPARITAIQPSRRGEPGEKIGVVVPDGKPWGTIERNTAVGISGRLHRLPPPGPVAHPLPVATASEVRPGPAQVLTVIEGEEPRPFAVEIERVTVGNRQDGRDLVIRVTDPELLARTGGIVQGMSGSPILQGGRVVGAVTHVFVSDGTRGYGVLAERMLEAAEMTPTAASVVADPWAQAVLGSEAGIR